MSQLTIPADVYAALVAEVGEEHAQKLLHTTVKKAKKVRRRPTRRYRSKTARRLTRWAHGCLVTASILILPVLEAAPIAGVRVILSLRLMQVFVTIALTLAATAVALIMRATSLEDAYLADWAAVRRAQTRTGGAARLLDVRCAEFQPVDLPAAPARPLVPAGVAEHLVFSTVSTPMPTPQPPAGNGIDAVTTKSVSVQAA